MDLWGIGMMKLLLNLHVANFRRMHIRYGLGNPEIILDGERMK